MAVARETCSLPCTKSLTTGGEPKQTQTGTSTKKDHVTFPGPAPVIHQESFIATITTRNIDMTSQVNGMTGQPTGTTMTLQLCIASIESTQRLKTRVDMVQTPAVMQMDADRAVAICLQAELQARMTRGISSHQTWEGPARVPNIAKDVGLRMNAIMIGGCIKNDRTKVCKTRRQVLTRFVSRCMGMPLYMHRV